MLQIPVNYTHADPIHDLQGDQLKKLVDDMKGVHLIMIDEKSMVSTTKLYQIDHRLKEAFPENNDLPFAGVSIILMGDYAQVIDI